MGQMARNTARRLGGLVLLLLVALPGIAGAEDEADAKAKRSPADVAAARYARELLVRRALESVRPDRMEEDGVARMRDEVKLRREEFLEIHRPSVLRADDLIDGAPGRGLIGEAARLYAWMAHMPPAPSPDAAPALDAGAQLHPIIVYRGTAERPDFGALVMRPGEEELSADAKAQLALGRRQASVRLRDKRLDVLRRDDGLVAIGPADKVRFLDLALASIRSGKTSVTDDETSMPATWLALTDRHELASRMSQAYIAAREIQVRERLAEFSTDVAPAGLVSERAVEEKIARAEAFHADAEKLEARQDAMNESLDWLVEAERELASELGSLGYMLEEAKAAVRAEEAAAVAEAEAEAEREAREAEAKAKAEAKAAEDDKGSPKDDDGKGSPKDDEGKDDEGKDDEGKDDAGTDEEGGADDGAEDAADDDDAPVAKSPAEVKVIALQLQEGVLKLKMRLLYLTVHRAVLRAQLYAAALKLAKEEARGASDVAARYQSELNRMRRERQLERLEYEETKLDLLLTDATSRASDPKHENRPLWLHWQQALESLKSVNRLTKEAVRLRRSFEARVSPNQAGMDDAPVDPGEGAVDVLRRFRRPGRVAFDVKYVEDAREAARSQDFDRALVARHHEVVSDRIASLDEALVLVAKDHGLAAGLEREVAAAEKALSDLETAAGKLADQGDRTNWLETVSETRREDFDTTRKAFEETLRGLDEKAQEARTLRDACLAFERELKLLGPRSFGIRVQRNLDGDNLGHAFQDAQDSVEDAGRWIAGRSEDNLATFVGTHWLMLLACVALVVAGVFFVRFARRGLDLAINRAARTVPELRFEPVTVRAEEAHAAREKAENEQAAKEAEAEALRMVSKEEAGKAQKMGEGGYGGGDE